MMFSSADPFAYPPNQPMTEFDNIKQENVGSVNSHGLQVPPIYLSNGSNTPSIYDDLEGQLFGPLPPYLVQGQQQFDISGQMDPRMTGQNLQEINYQSSVTPNGDMNFDGIFSGEGDDWSNMLAEQRYR